MFSILESGILENMKARAHSPISKVAFGDQSMASPLPFLFDEFATKLLRRCYEDSQSMGHK